MFRLPALLLVCCSLLLAGIDETDALAPAQKVTTGAYRFESFGGAELVLFPSDVAKIYVEGPLDNFGDGVPVGRGTVVASGDGKRPLEVKLPKGMFRIVVESEREITLRTSCRAGCGRPRVRPSELGGAVVEELLKFTGPVEKIDHGLVLPPMDRWGEYQKLLTKVDAKPLAHAPKLEVDLAAHLAAQKVDRLAEPPLVVEKPIPIRYGHYDNRALPERQVRHGVGLASLLNSLSEGNGSVARVGKLEARTPAELVDILIKSGHRVEMKQERVFANFLSFGTGGRDIQWPVWTDTGIRLPSGKTLRIPVGHTQYTWKIKGPLVDGEVAFFQGTGGTGFFPKLDQRPAWTGTVVTQTFGSADERDKIVKALDVAAKYRRRIMTESETVAKGAPAGSYAETGVCNNSTATIQTAITPDSRLPLPYPLLRNPALDTRFDDGLDDILKKLPFDGRAALSEDEILCRVLAMNPLADDSPVWKEEPFASFRLQLAEAKTLTKGRCGDAERRRAPKRATPTTH